MITLIFHGTCTWSSDFLKEMGLVLMLLPLMHCLTHQLQWMNECVGHRTSWVNKEPSEVSHRYWNFFSSTICLFSFNIKPWLFLLNLSFLSEQHLMLRPKAMAVSCGVWGSSVPVGLALHSWPKWCPGLAPAISHLVDVSRYTYTIIPVKQPSCQNSDTSLTFCCTVCKKISVQ